MFVEAVVVFIIVLVEVLLVDTFLTTSTPLASCGHFVYPELSPAISVKEDARAMQSLLALFI